MFCLPKTAWPPTSAYDTFAKATKQAVDVAESNFTAATQASLKAAAAANDAVKAKGRKAA